MQTALNEKKITSKKTPVHKKYYFYYYYNYDKI